MMNHKEIEAAVASGVAGKYEVTVDTFNAVADWVQDENDVLRAFFAGDPQVAFHTLLSLKGINRSDYPAIADYARNTKHLNHDFFYSLLAA